MENQFLKYREKVNTCLDAYDSVHNQLEKSFKGKSASIKALAHPFKKGHFTLAIIGKMSAGKSSFINALLKRPNLLATGYGQTTCMLTEIVHNETEGYKVFFADGHEESVNRTELQEYMKVPDKYSDLPVKQINKYIIEQG
ncbi:dynamin family protein [Porphyromonas gingivalis]|uniref:dynamin family protein n=1 Tax=Porphyromonas gingivalis TaxID=837 RepID=UPI001F3E5276|nr:dynamin family protein [Porphyromonas gingivalis]MCE8181173.1 dynamin family protein [Porphyromonas gingivalis]